MKIDLQKNFPVYSNAQVFSLTLLRILIGWHFLYEGLSKLFNLSWTSSYYLNGAIGPFAGFYKFLASSDSLLGIIDFINIWILILIGFSLFIGILSRPFKMIGIVLILLYYFAYPPIAGFTINLHLEGSYWIVNKTLIEFSALLVLLFFPTSHITGLDRFIHKKLPFLV